MLVGAHRIPNVGCLIFIDNFRPAPAIVVRGMTGLSRISSAGIARPIRRLFLCGRSRAVPPRVRMHCAVNTAVERRGAGHILALNKHG